MHSMLKADPGTSSVMTTDESATGENDAPTDTATANSRATGGRDPGTGPDAPQDRHSTTGTTSNDTPVGRVSGDETGDTVESGGERRAGRPQDAHDGALRDE
jgi:hypothetical protein